MWITLCVTAYKAGFCCGMQRTVIFIEFSPCQPERTPYNAPPSTRHNGLRNAVLRGFRRLNRRRKTSEKRG
ncbi:hypothetical protein ARC310_19190 [Pantoea ananatis]|nr:hypothetical protein ARC310_19190 [Pantoea ananatis]PZD60427.1 hypothetical protein ARC272_18555 [Pantoea ananatis]PZD60447.1 hypothetical protein ARC311_17735 [Pantoea ananatis]